MLHNIFASFFTVGVLDTSHSLLWCILRCNGAMVAGYARLVENFTAPPQTEELASNITEPFVSTFAFICKETIYRYTKSDKFHVSTCCTNAESSPGV